METVNLRVPEEMLNQLKRMTKEQLISRICEIAIETKVANNKVKDMQTKLDKCEAYNAQARAMIEAIMDRWDEYDV